MQRVCVLKIEVVVGVFASCWGVKSPLLFVTVDSVPGCQCARLHAAAKASGSPASHRLHLPGRNLNACCSLSMTVCVYVCDTEGTKEEVWP